jgi:hypothetical protein
MTAAIVTIFGGGRCRGFILHRCKGWEAFNADEQSLGLFAGAQEAAAAIEGNHSDTGG